MKTLTFCNNCIAFSTRPRISFNKEGVCSACQWSHEKKKLNWNVRQKELSLLLKKNKSNKSKYDCIVPVSGGKDGSYVAYKLKHKFKMNVLTITVRPPLETKLGIENLNSFIKSGYSHMHISPDDEAMRTLNRIGFEKMGFPYYGWLISIHTAIMKAATMMKIPLIVYSEDGEIEYGGDTKYKNKSTYSIDYQISHYLEGGYNKIINLAKKNGISESQLYWFKFPSKQELESNKIRVTHFSYFENWDPYRNYVIAKEKCGLKERETLSQGSYTNFAQIDQELYPLHVYLMYLKFGFGRTTQDACIDVRRGSMTRKQAIELAKRYDDFFPSENFKKYANYYKISESRFHKIIDKWVNKKLFVKKKKWVPKFKIR